MYTHRERDRERLQGRLPRRQFENGGSGPESFVHDVMNNSYKYCYCYYYIFIRY